MARSSPRGMFLVSVDCAATSSDSLSLGGVDQQLLRIFEDLQISGTWALAEPAQAPLGQRLIAAHTPQEVALLGDDSWVGRSAGRGKFARELARRMVAARAAGMSIASLAVRGTRLEENLDLVVRHELTAIRNPLSTDHRLPGDAKAKACRVLHYGVWELPPTLHLPATGNWVARQMHALRVRRAINRAAASGGIVHVAIDSAQVEETLPAIGTLLRHAARRRDQDRLTITTMSDMALRLSRYRQSTGAVSILRRAA